MNEDWTSLSAVLEQIIRLQPNFFSVWDFQGHNLSYNISVEFDDYRDRFYWVMKGIEFLKEGIAVTTPPIRGFWPASAGFTATRSAGPTSTCSTAGCSRSSRKKRRKAHRQLAGCATIGTSRREDWSIRASRCGCTSAASRKPDATSPAKRPPARCCSSPKPPMALINYADTMEEEGTFGDTAKAAWENAAREWNDYTKRRSFHLIRLHGAADRSGRMSKANGRLQRSNREAAAGRNRESPSNQAWRS